MVVLLPEALVAVEFTVYMPPPQYSVATSIVLPLRLKLSCKGVSVYPSGLLYNLHKTYSRPESAAYISNVLDSIV